LSLLTYRGIWLPNVTSQVGGIYHAMGSSAVTFTVASKVSPSLSVSSFTPPHLALAVRRSSLSPASSEITHILLPAPSRGRGNSNGNSGYYCCYRLVRRGRPPRTDLPARAAPRCLKPRTPVDNVKVDPRARGPQHHGRELAVALAAATRRAEPPISSEAHSISRSSRIRSRDPIAPAPGERFCGTSPSSLRRLSAARRRAPGV